jgi:biotin carboxylase
MDFTGKKLLILCGNVIHCKVVEAAKEMGIYTIVTDSIPFEEAPAKQMADEALMLNVLDIDGIVEWCQNNHVDGVINFCNDIAQRPHQQICERLGLPSYGTAEQYYMFTDKRAFKKMCIENGIDVIPEYSEEDIENGAIEYPVLVKPVDSRGSRGQAVCYTKEELVAALPHAKEASSNNAAIIEKYMYGKQEFSMSYLVADGISYLTRTSDRLPGKEQDGLNKQCICAISPSLQTNAYLVKINSLMGKLFRKISIKNSAILMQCFIDDETFRFFDPGIRFPGNEYDSILYRATGINTMKYCIEIALTGRVVSTIEGIETAFLMRGCVSIQLMFTAREGRISNISGLDEIARHPSVVTVSQRYFVGDSVPNSGDIRQRVCEIALLADKHEEKAVVDWIQSKLMVLDENGNDMLVSKFDSAILAKIYGGNGE